MKKLMMVSIVALAILLIPLNVFAKTSYRTSTICKSNGDGTCNIVYTMQITENSKTYDSIKYTFEFNSVDGKQNGIEKITFTPSSNANVNVEETENGYVVTYTAKEGKISGSTFDLGSYTVTRKTGSEYSSRVKFIAPGETKIITYDGKTSSSGVSNPNTGVELPLIILSVGLVGALAFILYSNKKQKMFKI